MALIGNKSSAAAAQDKGQKTANRVPNAPASIFQAFQAQGTWKSWVMVCLIGLLFLSLFLNVRLASKPAEFVLVDAQTGDATLVKRSVATSALLEFVADKTRPPEVAVVKFVQDFLHLALAVNSSTIENNWAEALARMTPSLRAKLAAEAEQQKLVETYKAAQRKTDLGFESIVLLDRTARLLAVRAEMKRRVAPLLDTGAGPSAEDRIQVDTVLEIVPATVEYPAGLRVAEFRLAKKEPLAAATAAPTK